MILMMHQLHHLLLNLRSGMRKEQKRLKDFYLKYVVVLHYFFPSCLNRYHNLDLSDFVYLNYLLIEILK